MTQEEAANWRDLCNAALTARDPNRLLEIIRKLNATLRREEKARNPHQTFFSKYKKDAVRTGGPEWDR